MASTCQADAVAEFNAMAFADAAAAIQACAAIPSWTTAVLDGRPYPDPETLVARAALLAREWSDDEVDRALSQHPRIGSSPEPTDPESRMSAEEQSGVTSDAAAIARIRQGNLAYERRFGRVFLIRAAGRDAAEIADELDRRLALDEASEQAEVAQQLREIALLRLRSVIGT